MLFFKRKKYPITLTKGNHPLSLSQVDRGIRDIMSRLRNNGYQACLVGGGVRDLLLGKKPKDLDIATDARPRQVKRLFKQCFLIGRRFRLAHVYIAKNKFVEVATFRAVADPEKFGGDQYAMNNIFGTIEQDALRRDFTVNALYFDSATSSIIDYTGGLRDIKKKILRSIGDPVTRLKEDPVRMIRAARFCAQLGLTPSRKDFKAIKLCAEKIAETNARRLLDELLKILKCASCGKTFENLIHYGLLMHWIPEIAVKEIQTTMVRRLKCLDAHIAAEEEIPECVMIAVLFYDIFLKSIKTAAATRFQEAYHAINKDFHVMAVRLCLSRAEWERVCNIVARQVIVNDIGSGPRWKNFERKFVDNEYYQTTIQFLEILVEAGESDTAILKYWKSRSSTAPREGDNGERSERSRGRRRRRRPKDAKKAEQTTEQTS